MRWPGGACGHGRERKRRGQDVVRTEKAREGGIHMSAAPCSWHLAAVHDTADHVAPEAHPPSLIMWHLKHEAPPPAPPHTPALLVALHAATP